MPTYEYTCSACNTRVERFLRIADRDNPGPCDSCGAQALRKLITPPNVVIDGTDPGFPGAASKWEQDRMRRMSREQKNQQTHGTEYPNLKTI